MWQQKEQFVTLLGEHGAKCGTDEAELFQNKKGAMPLENYPPELVQIYEEAAARFKAKRLPPCELQIQEATWVQQGEGCMICTRGFSMWVRKHHCRKCGWLVCHACSNMKVQTGGKDVRVCDGCFNNLGSPDATLRQQARPPSHVGVAEASPRSSAANSTTSIEEDRASLFGRGGAQAAVAERSSHDRLAGGMDNTKDVMADNLKSLQERGDTINQIADSSEQLAKASGGFAAAAKAMRQQQEKKANSWFPF